MSTFDPIPLMREIARGRHGARELTRAAARDLFAAALAGSLPEATLGALLVAFRIKGETATELAGMLDATQPHVAAIAAPPGKARTVIIPSYNGARKLANQVPLVALLLARAGVPVLVHGMAQEARRVSAFDVFERLGHAAARSPEAITRALEERRVAVAPLEALSPALARILTFRSVIGVRNVGHTLAKLIRPIDKSLRLVAVTHPDVLAQMRDFFATEPADAFLMRGTEGEPVVRPGTAQPVEFFGSHGERETWNAASPTEADWLPAREADATATWTSEVLAGAKDVPAALAGFVEFIARHSGAATRSPALRVVGRIP